MRGRATGVALPALLVLGLVALVAIAATGSTSTGSDGSREPSDTLLDMLFTLWLLAIVAGGVLLVYGLAQRRAIARELASGRYRRATLLQFIVLVGLFTAFVSWRFSKWGPQANQADEGEGLFSPRNRPIDRSDPEDVYHPSVSWIAIALVVALVLAAVITYLVAERRTRRAVREELELEEQIALVLDDTLDDLRAEADPRRAVIAAYARLERVLAANGVRRADAETPAEYLRRILGELTVDPAAIEQLTRLFTRAKFSQHEIDVTMKEDAIGALERVRDELRVAREPQPPAVAPPAPAGAAS